MDRINNDGHYEPGNIRLVSRSENANNRRVTTFIVVGGDRLSMSDFRRRHCPGWASPNAVAHHLRRGRSGDEISQIYRQTIGGV